MNFFDFMMTSNDILLSIVGFYTSQGFHRAQDCLIRSSDEKVIFLRSQEEKSGKLLRKLAVTPGGYEILQCNQAFSAQFCNHSLVTLKITILAQIRKLEHGNRLVDSWDDYENERKTKRKAPLSLICVYKRDDAEKKIEFWKETKGAKVWRRGLEELFCKGGSPT